MNDTSSDIALLVAARYQSMSPSERLQIAASMYETARSIVASSLPSGLTREQRRYAIAKRMYGDELTEVALRAHANFPHNS